MITAIILALYIIGVFVAYNKIKEWNNNTVEKVFFSIVWPPILILYGIHWLYNKE